MATVWMEEALLHQGVVDSPEGLCLRVFYFEEARAWTPSRRSMSNLCEKLWP
jgi:hypothetical protein